MTCAASETGLSDVSDKSMLGVDVWKRNASISDVMW